MRLDPRVKLLIIAVLTSLAVFAKDLVYLSALLGTAVLVDIVLRADIVSALKRLRPLLSLILFISIVQSLTIKSGVAIIHIANVRLITTSGLISGAEFALRMGIIIFASIIATTEKGRGMTDALIRLRMPYEIAFMVSVTISFFPMFREEFSARVRALKLRGIDISRLKFGQKLKAYSYLFSPAVAGGIIKSRALARAMEARAFRAYPQRTMLRELRMRSADYVVILLSTAYLAAFIATSVIIGGII